MAIPAIAPPESPEWPWPDEEELELEEDAGEEPVALGVDPALVEKGSGVDSDGQGSPGSSINVEFRANCLCTAKVCVLFGLIAPTIP